LGENKYLTAVKPPPSKGHRRPSIVEANLPGDNEIPVRSFADSDAIPKWMPETAEEISQRPEVRRELERSTSESQRNQISARGTDKFWFVTYLVVLFGCVVVYIALGSALISVSQVTTAFIQRLLRGVAAVIFLPGLAKAISVYLLGKIEDPSTRFTLRRIEHLIVAILIALVAISVTVKNWYAALTALGIGSIILGLAVQTPMTSFIGWIYILVRRPYQVGDRIKIDDATGDVIDVSYLDTTLWEFGGQYISGDHPSGRVIKFPNSKVLNSIVYNYSWPLFPYIWTRSRFMSPMAPICNSLPTPCSASPRRNLAEKCSSVSRFFAKCSREHPWTN